MSGIQFAHPEYAHALWGVVVIAAILIFFELRRDRALERFIRPGMQTRLANRPTTTRRLVSQALLVVSLVAIVIALMRPQWGIEFIKTPQVGAEIMIAIDVSRSMLAEDVAPNRLERAKAEIRDLLPYLEGDQVGLIAFAGRASVLCPLTPDFGFLRLVLDHVGVDSVPRGGTRLEEPIRKATEGFGSSGDLARVLLFFTDGEDHDSFPLDAAREAAERGIRIVIIGFGDETGSEIWVTDAATGARTRIQDEEGRPAISRLDGELLRELALVTEGAYVPAGTGVLDLESIFEAHLQPLMRGEGEAKGRTIQKDGFAWALLIALVALVGHVMLAGGRRRPSTAGIALIFLFLPMDDAAAQNPPTESVAATQAASPNPGEQSTANLQPRLDLPEDPREAYNRALTAMEVGDLDDAEQLFAAARREARHDGTLRFQATFNQSWVEVMRADSTLESDPAASLASLELAADWLREAVALRPDNESARVNLEIVLNKALVLSDALAQKEPPDIARRLDSLIEAQRAVTRSIREVAGQVEQSPDIDPDEAARARFRRVAVEQRTVLTDAGQLAEIVGNEIIRLEQKPEAEQTPEERMQAAGLQGLIHYLHRGRERIGQARVQLRRRQATRAHRRASAGLLELKRAREQLLGPVELIDGLIQDTSLLAQETAVLGADTLDLTHSAHDAPNRPPVPAWLDIEYLEQNVQSASERASELNAKLSAGIGQAPEPSDPEQIKALEQLQEAQPHIQRASSHLAEATDALASQGGLDRALQEEMASLAALMDAREQFLDLKGLIEAAWADQVRIQGPIEGEQPETLAELATALSSLQSHNLGRVERMTDRVEQQRANLEMAPADPASTTPEDIDSERERLELADGILALVESAMRGASESLDNLTSDESSIGPARERVGTAVRGLESLRRLFFSIIEHLREVARLQFELGDETESMAGRSPHDRILGPLEQHQQQLAERSEKLAETLHQQSFAQPEELVGPQAAQDPAAAEEAAERLTRASELVLLASQNMLAAADGLEPEEATTSAQDPPSNTSDLEPVRTQQDAALDNLSKALAILEPPPPESDESSGQEPDADQSEQESQSQPEGGDDSEDQEAADPNQLLQAVRDREAERHRSKNARDPSGYSPVEKDW